MSALNLTLILAIYSKIYLVEDSHHLEVLLEVKEEVVLQEQEKEQILFME